MMSARCEAVQSKSDTGRYPCPRLHRDEHKHDHYRSIILCQVFTFSPFPLAPLSSQAVKAVRIEEESRNRERKKAGIGKKRVKGTTDRDGKKVKR